MKSTLFVRLEILFKKTWAKNLAVASVLLLFNIVFLSGLWRGESLVGKDTLTFSLPYGQILHEALLKGELPLWSQLLNFPAHAESQGAFLYPPNLFIYWLWNGASGYNFTVILHLLFMSWGMYLLARHHRLGRMASLLAGVAFTYGAFIILRVNINNFFTNGAWAPWVLLTALLSVEKLRGLPVAGLAATTAMMLLTGHFQITSYTLITAVIIALVRGRYLSDWKGFGKSVLALVCGIGLGLLIASPQLLPTLELAGLSVRSSQSYSTLTDYSLFPPQLLTMLLPALFGRAEHPMFFGMSTISDYWGQGSFWELTLYFSVIALTLAITASFQKGWRFYGILAVVFLILSMGKYLPGYQFLARFPPLSLFRIPARMGFITVLLGSLLAGVGLEQLRTQPQLVAKRTFRIILACIILIASVLLVANLAGPSNISQLAEGKGLSDAGKATRQEFLSLSIAHSLDPFRLDNLIPITLILLALVIVGLLWRRYISPRFATLILFLGIALELICFGMGYNYTVCPNIYGKEPPTAQFLQSQYSHRIYCSGWDISLNEDRWGFLMLHPNSMALWNLGLAVPRASLLPASSTSLMTQMDNVLTKPGDGSFPYRELTSAARLDNPRPLQMAGIDHIVRLHPLEGDAVLLEIEFDPIKVYRLKDPCPQAYLVGEVEVERDPRVALAKAINNDYSWHKHAVVNQDTGILSPGEGTITSLQEDDNSLIATVTTTTSQMLVLDRLSYPGWQAKLDDTAVDTITVNGWEMGVIVPPGVHNVCLTFCYRTWGFGLVLAGLGLLGAFGLVILDWRRNKKQE